MLPKQKHPEQFHKKKEETFHILYGDLDLYLDDKFYKLHVGSTITIKKGVRHKFHTSKGCVFEEISSTINLADTFYENSFYSIKVIPFSFRFSILVARRIYRKIGYKILNKKNLENYQNAGKIYVSNLEKGLETFLAILDLIKLSLTYKKDDQIRHDHILINEEINLDERF